MRLIEAIGFYAFVVVVVGVWIDMAVENWLHRRRPRPYDYEIDGE